MGRRWLHDNAALNYLVLDGGIWIHYVGVWFKQIPELGYVNEIMLFALIKWENCSGKRGIWLIWVYFIFDCPGMKILRSIAKSEKTKM